MSFIKETDGSILLDDLKLIRKIAAGGMAEVWEARQVGIEGFEKRMAVKVVLPHLNDNEEFIRMFLDEGRLAAKLDHPNICQLYKLGSAQNVYYMAMEFIDGIVLSSLLKAAAKKEISLEFQHCCQILVGACEGLDYAHSCTDRDGTPLNLVHRDISPQNIMLTYNGGVKLVDFGIAKATSHINRTQAGVIKGKYAYMSPEQASGRPLDRRSDIFALGTILWEITTGYRLFRSENDFATLNKIIKGEYERPSEYRENYPPELEAIVMKALSVDPNNRFNDCGDMQLALEDFLLRHNMAAGSKRLARYMDWVMAEDIAEDSADTEILKDGLTPSFNNYSSRTPTPNLTPSPRLQEQTPTPSVVVLPASDSSPQYTPPSTSKFPAPLHNADWSHPLRHEHSSHNPPVQKELDSTRDLTGKKKPSPETREFHSAPTEYDMEGLSDIELKDYHSNTEHESDLKHDSDEIDPKQEIEKKSSSEQDPLLFHSKQDEKTQEVSDDLGTTQELSFSKMLEHSQEVNSFQVTDPSSQNKDAQQDDDIESSSQSMSDEEELIVPDGFAATIVGGKQNLSFAETIESPIDMEKLLASGPSDKTTSYRNDSDKETLEDLTSDTTEEGETFQTSSSRVDQLIDEVDYEKQALQTSSSKKNHWKKLILLLLVFLMGGGGFYYYYYVLLPRWQDNATNFEPDQQILWLIRTVPPKAKIFINGKLKGLTPKMIPMTVGQGYLLRLSLKGYRDYVKRIPEFTEKFAQNALAVSLEKGDNKGASGKLILDVWPKKTRVFVNKQPITFSPLGVYSIKRRVRHPLILFVRSLRYRSLRRIIQLKPHSTIRLSLRLKLDYCQLNNRNKRRCGQLFVKIKGAKNSIIEVDGEKVGVNELSRYYLRQGRHTLRVSKIGAKTVTRSFHIEKRQIHRIVIRLR